MHREILGGSASRLLVYVVVLVAVPGWAVRSTFGDAAATKPAVSAADASKTLGVPTHHQGGIVQVNAAGRPQVRVSCFCLTPDDKILAGCTGAKGEIQVLDADGKLTDSWALPVNPEAITCRADGAIFVAGDGQVIKLSADGKVELTKESPQAAAIKEHPEKLREEVVAQVKEQAKQFTQQAEIYDKMIAQSDQQITALKDQISAAEKSANASSKRSLEARLAMYNNQKTQYEEAKSQFAKIIGATESGELTDQQIDERVKSSMAYKLKASSVSALDGDVFLATHAAAGYGFEIWRMDDRFENPVKIVKDLSGCCGQMDAKVNKDGLFVAENSRHRVCHFDRDGKSLGAFGESARTGLEGFGSCCNPMNVAFGPADAVYTAEDDTGRIKRYSADGKLLGLVGSVELKPGCKNCSIAVSKDGGRVYMLDITRNYVVRLDARPADEITAEAEKMKNAPASATPPGDAGASAQPETSSSTGALLLRGLGALLSGR